jgi:hypothetical protein
MHISSDSTQEAMLHRNAIDVLIKDTKRSFAEVKQLYEAELARLESGAQIRQFLPLLASRHVRELLRNDSPHLP